LSRPVCSVVVPSFNGRRLLETCLASIERHRPRGIPVEVVVADDGSTDGTGDWLRRAHPSVRLVRLESNAGFCGAANAGITAARGDFIQLLNNDTEVTAGWVEAGLAPFDDPAVGSVAPLVLMRSEPSLVDSAGDSYTVVGRPSKRGHGEPAVRWLDRPVGRVFGASASSAFYRAEALRRVGGFDPVFREYFEDVDLAFRLRWAGYECAFAPACRVLHDVSATYDHSRPGLQRRMARNAELLFWYNLPARWLLAAALPHAVFLVAQGFHRLVHGRARAFWRGKLDALRFLPSVPEQRRRRHDLARSPANGPAARHPASLRTPA
jgi:GT2 family glycosyltransferase